MRIIAGKYGGRTIVRPKSGFTRPMSDKVREALFNIIGSVEGLDVLDAYAGSGAVGFEALSRGAKSTALIEKAREPLAAIRQTAKELNVGEELRVIAGSVEQAIKSLGSSTFNLMIADPPYEAINPSVLEQMAGLLAEDGQLIVSHSSRIDAPQLESVERSETRTYGDSALSFYR